MNYSKTVGHVRPIHVENAALKTALAEAERRAIATFMAGFVLGAMAAFAFVILWALSPSLVDLVGAG